MYLTAERYVSAYEFSNAEDKQVYADLLKAVRLTMEDIDQNTPSATVKFTVAYWRKANAVHKWFVDNVQKGKDDCGSYSVSRKELVQLRDLCAELVAAKDDATAKEKLSPQAGFFFGSTEVDEWYWDDLVDTVKMLTAILDNPKLEDFDFEYRASW
jgi:hypothetical protein